MIQVRIDISKQRMTLFDDECRVKLFGISTSKFGVGSKSGSNKTPLGLHQIVSKIGKNAVLGAVFVRRRKTGEVARISRRIGRASKDLITTRILWLKGLEPGVNCGEGIDSFRRCIYIHGTPDEGLIGRRASHGCIRMKNKDIVMLFGLVTRGTIVDIRR